MNKTIIISIIAAILLMIGAFALSTGNNASDNAQLRGNNSEETGGGSNVSIVDGKQIIVIGAKGGYNPRKSIAKAGVPTIIRFKTQSTFDCSSFIRIPSLNISQALPQSGSTDIDVGTQSEGILKGTCGMGMYNFQIEFRP